MSAVRIKICVIGNTAYCAKWLVNADFTDNFLFYVEPEGVYCYTKQELEKVKHLLSVQGITYQIKDLPEPPGFSVTKGIKYASRSEALAHIEQGIEPESMLIPNLKKQLAAAEGCATNAEAWAAAAAYRAQKADEKIEALIKEIESSKQMLSIPGKL